MPAFPDCTGFMAISCTRNGLIASISSSVEQLTGYSAPELVGQPITFLMADCSVFEAPRMLDSARESGLWQGEVAYRSGGGESFRARATLTALTGQNETLSGYLLVSILDLRAEDSCNDPARRDTAARLRAISHAINNPLAVMMGFAQLILLSTRCEGQIRVDMEKLYSELKRVIQIVEELHSYAVSLQEAHNSRDAESERSLCPES